MIHNLTSWERREGVILKIVTNAILDIIYILLTRIVLYRTKKAISIVAKKQNITKYSSIKSD